MKVSDRIIDFIMQPPMWLWIIVGTAIALLIEYLVCLIILDISLTLTGR